METVFHTKMVGVVTLYNPNPQEAAENVMRYLPSLDWLILWDNSPLEANLQQQMMTLLADEAGKVMWHGTGENLCIAPAINFAWHYAQEHGFDMLLIMDQDSQWDCFEGFRQQVEQYWQEGRRWVFTPYFKGYEFTTEGKDFQQLRVFINSGTIIPVEILTAVGGADERLPLDAVDSDMAIRIQKVGYTVVCITSFTLHHQMGTPSYTRLLNLKTYNYNARRTYSIARGQMINLRKHSDWLTNKEKKGIIKKYYLRRAFLIIFHETDKWNRLKMLIKGTVDGLRCKI